MIDPPPRKQPPATVLARLRENVRPCLRVSLISGTVVLLAMALCLGIVALLALAAFRTNDPPGSMLIWSQRLEGRDIDQRWVPLAQISPNLVRAVVMSEDNQFCRHHGVDIREFTAAIERAEQMGDDNVRGGSTISMQVAKNLFLWNGRSYVRKAIELPLTLLMELLWPKHRIMEVYLNIAEWGPGIFGAEAASQYHFRKPASRLTEREAALLAVALPNPLIRVPSRPTANLVRVASVIEKRARAVGSRASCVLER